MANERPRHVMRNANLFIDRENLVGQASEISFFKLEREMQEVYNAGQEVPIEVETGFKLPEHSFKMTGFHPEQLKLFGLKVGSETEIMATASNEDDDGTVHSMVAYLRCKIKSVDPDAFKKGDVAEVGYECAFRYFKLEIDGEPIYEIDPFRVVIGGVDQFESRRRALML